MMPVRVNPSEGMIDLTSLVACSECDLLMRTPPTALGECICCLRCGHEAYRRVPQIMRRSLALVMTALLLYVPAIFLPIMQLNFLGQTISGTLWDGVTVLYINNMPILAVVVFLCSMGIPLLKLCCQFLVLLSIQWDIGRSYGLLLYRGYRHLREWGMLEIYLMGILVSIVKLSGLADLTLGLGLGFFVGLLLVQLCLESTMSSHQIWHALSLGGINARH